MLAEEALDSYPCSFSLSFSPLGSLEQIEAGTRLWSLQLSPSSLDMRVAVPMGGQQSSPWAASAPHRGSPHSLWGSMHDPLGLPGHCLGSLQGRGHNLCQASWCRTPEGSVGGLRVGNGAFSWDPGSPLSPQTFPDTGTPVSPSQGSAASAHHLLVIAARAP